MSPQYQSIPPPQVHSQGGGEEAEEGKDKLGLTRVRVGSCDTKNRVSAIQLHHTICILLSPLYKWLYIKIKNQPRGQPRKLPCIIFFIR